jgi:hypothetical protein
MFEASANTFEHGVATPLTWRAVYEAFHMYKVLAWQLKSRRTLLVV